MTRYLNIRQRPLLDEDNEPTTRAELEADIHVWETPVTLTPGLVDEVARLQRRAS